MKKKKIAVVTGCCGFIGSHVTEFLVQKGYYVIGIDNLSTGNLRFLNKINKKKFKFYKIDLLKNKLDKCFNKAQIIFHFAANADVRFGLSHRDKDIKQNILVTHKILEQMVKYQIKKIIFSSTGSVYGETKEIPTKENTSFPIQTSLYGASKISAEALISAYSEAYNLNSYIFRFVSILGQRYSHGHVYDFLNQLIDNPNKLYILGNGYQKKSYLHVSDCVNGIWVSIKKFKDKVNIINLGTPEYITVRKSVRIICNKLRLKPKLKYSGGKQGWIGDNPFIFLNTKKVNTVGWRPKFTIEKSIQNTVDYLLENKWILKKKKL